MALVTGTTPLGMRIDEGLGGTPADLSVRIFGPELERLASLTESARDVMAKIDGIEDLRVEKLTGLPQLRVSIDRAAAARVGLTPGDVIRAVRVGLVGEEVSEVSLGPRRFDLVVRLQDRGRSEIERPLAIVMIGGLVTSTLFTLLALPAFYLFVHQLQDRFSRSSHG